MGTGASSSSKKNAARKLSSGPNSTTSEEKSTPSAGGGAGPITKKMTGTALASKKSQANIVSEAGDRSSKRKYSIVGGFGFGSNADMTGRGRSDSAFQMTQSEAAFLTRDVRERLANAAGQLPPAPAMFPKQGACLFVDISGFTALGDRLRQEFPTQPKVAAGRLSSQITYVLGELTRTAIQLGGDVAKFAGDALLCTFISPTLEESLSRAHNCAILMLMGMRMYNLSAGGNSKTETLQLHGGIAAGSILHFHLGSSDDELRWYLTAGDAVNGATSLVDKASPGQILMITSTSGMNAAQAARQLSKNNLLDSDGVRDSPKLTIPEAGVPMGIFGFIEEETDAIGSPKQNNTTSPRANIFKSNIQNSKRGSLDSDTARSDGTNPIKGMNRSRNRDSLGSEDSASQHAESKIVDSRNSLVKVTSQMKRLSQNSVRSMRAKLSMDLLDTGSNHGEGDGETDNEMVSQVVIITADTQKLDIPAPQSPAGGGGGGMAPGATKKETSIYDVKLHSSGNVYLPKALRHALRHGFNSNEMRDNVAIVFVGLSDLSLSEEELAVNTIKPEKLDQLNVAFVQMTRVAHSFSGEIRDLLFDDKGCIFIAVFGAHAATEIVEGKAVKAAMAIAREFPKSKVGVSVGTCFVGMCGTQKRHDFVVMGHEVNMAARNMLAAREGEVYVSKAVQAVTEQLIQYEEVTVAASKKSNAGDLLEQVFRPKQELTKRPSFLAQYRYGLRDRDLFVGRNYELNKIEDVLNLVCFGESPTRGSGANVEGNNNNNNNTTPPKVVKANSANEPNFEKINVTSKDTLQVLQKTQRAVDTGIIVVEAVAGMGKSALVSRAKKLGKGRIKIAVSAAFSLEQSKPFYIFYHLLEAYTGFREEMTPNQMNKLSHDYGGSDDENSDLNLKILSEILPFLSKASKEGNLQAQPINNNGNNGKDNAPSQEMINNLGKEVLKVFSGFRGELTLQQVLHGEPNNGALLILEDIQWMDISSLRLLLYLLDHLDQVTGLCILLTVRPDDSNKLNRGQVDTEKNRLLKQVLDLAKMGPKARLFLKLDGLKKEDADKLVHLILQSHHEEGGVDAKVLEFIYDKTDGFPMYLSLLLEWIKERNMLKANEKGVLTWVTPETPDTAQFPNSLADTMIARFDRLTPTSKNVLKLATLMGDEFDAIALTTFVNLDLDKKQFKDEDVIACLNEAMERGILVVKKSKGIKTAAHKWRFKHDTILSAIQSLIPEERQAQLKNMLKPMRQEVEKKKLVPLFGGFLGEVDD